MVQRSHISFEPRHVSWCNYNKVLVQFWEQETTKRLTKPHEVCHGLRNRTFELVVGKNKLMEMKERVKHVGDRSSEFIACKIQCLEIGQSLQGLDGTGKLVVTDPQIHYKSYNSKNRKNPIIQRQEETKLRFCSMICKYTRCATTYYKRFR